MMQLLQKHFLIMRNWHYNVSQKSIPDIFDCNLTTNYQILILFGTNIPETSCRFQMTIQFPTSPAFCFCTTWGKHNQRNNTQCDMIAYLT